VSLATLITIGAAPVIVTVVGQATGRRALGGTAVLAGAGLALLLAAVVRTVRADRADEVRPGDGRNGPHSA
jgi:hypothetical protein